jgi:hypothetical protein
MIRYTYFAYKMYGIFLPTFSLLETHRKTNLVRVEQKAIFCILLLVSVSVADPHQHAQVSDNQK